MRADGSVAECYARDCNSRHPWFKSKAGPPTSLHTESAITGAKADLMGDRCGLDRFLCERCCTRGVTVIAPLDDTEHCAYGGHANAGLPPTRSQAHLVELGRHP